MGIASLILGIISLIISFIPVIGFFAFFPAVAAFVLGIVDIVKKSKTKEKKGISIAGLVLSIVSVFMMVFSLFGFGVFMSLVANEIDTNSIYYNSTDDYFNSSTSEPITNKTYTIGEIATVDDLKVTYVASNSNFKDYSEYANIKSGHKVIKADFEFENVATTSNLASSYDFNCYADGYDCDSFYYVDNSSFSSTLSAGKKTKGSVYFEVPISASEIVLEYMPNSFTGEKVTFKVQ